MPAMTAQRAAINRRRRRVWAALSSECPQPSGRELAQRLGCGQATIWGDIDVLIGLVYVARSGRYRARAVSVLIPFLEA